MPCVARNIIIKIVYKYLGSSNSAFIFQMSELSLLTNSNNSHEVQYLEVFVLGAHFRKASCSVLAREYS